MTAVTTRRVDLRLSAGFWIGFGLLMAFALTQSSFAHASVPESTLLVRTPCALRLSTADGRGNARSFDLREAALYRLQLARQPDVVAASSEHRLRTSELPLGDRGELLIPARWCPASAAPPSVGLGNLAP